ncbi:hypothetical protein BH23ACT2_BH23ACT2_06500 [soil metagenome]
MRLHPMWSRRILARCRGLEPMAAVAGSHHERLDGSGYPSGTRSESDTATGLLACADLFDERCSPRPYRSALDPPAVADQMGELAAAGALGSGQVDAVLGAAGVTDPVLTVDRPGGLTEREVDVLRLLAYGSTNRQIAGALGISPKTVGAHIEHIYLKANVASRAAATLFAMRQGLLG